MLLSVIPPTTLSHVSGRSGNLYPLVGPSSICVSKLPLAPSGNFPSHLRTLCCLSGKCLIGTKVCDWRLPLIAWRTVCALLPPAWVVVANFHHDDSINDFFSDPDQPDSQWSSHPVYRKAPDIWADPLHEEKPLLLLLVCLWEPCIQPSSDTGWQLKQSHHMVISKLLSFCLCTKNFSSSCLFHRVCICVLALEVGPL